MWEEGNLLESQSFLREKTLHLISHGVNTLEEMSTLSRYYLQCARLNDESVSPAVEIAEQLRKNTGDWLEYLNAKGQLELSQRNFALAQKTFEKCRDKAAQYGDKYHFGLSLLGLIQVNLAQNICDQNVTNLSREFEIAMARLVETPVKVHTHLVRAAIAYKDMDFSKCKHHLNMAANTPRIGLADKFVVDVWRATANGKSVRIIHNWQRQLLKHMTKIYFNPSLEMTGKSRFLVSSIYPVDLSNYPAMVSLLEYLLKSKRFSASPEKIQEQVWGQTISMQGWRQKIRNTITRLRDQFPFTMAPLFIHNDEIELFAEVINMQPFVSGSTEPHDEVIRILREGPMSTNHLANRLDISLATAKRILRRLNEEERITVMKVGRRVFYQSLGE